MTQPEKGKPGARKRKPKEKFSTYILVSNRKLLEEYAERHDISLAEAINKAIWLLCGEEKDGQT